MMNKKEKNSKNSSQLTERLLLNSTAADVWAAEFVGIHGGDEGLMIGWFANAIEAGRAEGSRGSDSSMSYRSS